MRHILNSFMEVTVPASESNTKQGRVSIWVKLFVLFHLVAITSWAIPSPPSAVERGKVTPAGTQWIPYWNKKYIKPSPPITLYLTTTGFWQYWDMFAPDPAQTDSWGDADIIFKDGSMKHYQYPRMFLLSIPLKLIKERYRKYFERAGSDDFNYLWGSFAYRVAYQFDDSKNPPVRVKLYRHWRPVAQPGQVQNEQYGSYMYYELVVNPQILADLHEAGH